MFRKARTLLLLLLFPVLLCVNIWQSFRYQQLQDELAVLQVKQVELLEKNRQALAAVAVYSSPSRVGALVEEDLGLHKKLKKAEAGDVFLLQKEKP